jgi:hypothetical protein
MEIKRYISVCFFKKEMRKDLFNIDLNNSSDEFSLLSPQLTNHNIPSGYKKISISKWKKIN